MADIARGKAHNAILDLLLFVGENIHREGLEDTPERAVQAWIEWTEGYGMKPEDILTSFTDGGEDYDEMILVKDIPFYSHCEHHMAPFFGVAHIAYIPSGRIVGLSKLSRLLDIYAHRLQVQERITSQVSQALMTHLEPIGVAVQLVARHLCMESRGIVKQGHTTITTKLNGAFRSDAKARAEFLALIK